MNMDPENFEVKLIRGDCRSAVVLVSCHLEKAVQSGTLILRCSHVPFPSFLCGGVKGSIEFDSQRRRM